MTALIPAVQDADTKTGQQTTGSTSWTATYPTNIQEGDLLIAFFAVGGDSDGFAMPAGWIIDPARNPNTSIPHAKKKATGSESGNFTATFTNSLEGEWIVYRITDWSGNIGSSFANTGASGDVAAQGASGTSTTPDPTSVNPNNWGDTSTTLWLAVCSVDASTAVTGFPTNYTNTYSHSSGGANGASLGIARRALAATSENPGAFTIASSQTWFCITLAIRGKFGPTLHDTDTLTGVQTSNASTWNPATPKLDGNSGGFFPAGELLVCCLAIDGSNDTYPTGFPTGWVIGLRSTVAQNAAVRLVIAFRVTGSETDIPGSGFTPNITDSEQGSWASFRITNWQGTGLAAQGDANSDGISWSTTAGVSSTPNPPNLDPANWATEDTLWMALTAVDTSRTVSVWPFADRNQSVVSGGAGGATLGFCTLHDAVSSKDPGTFTVSTSDDWIAATVGIRPSSIVAMPTPPIPRAWSARALNRRRM